MILESINLNTIPNDRCCSKTAFMQQSFHPLNFWHAGWFMDSRPRVGQAPLSSMNCLQYISTWYSKSTTLSCAISSNALCSTTATTKTPLTQSLRMLLFRKMRIGLDRVKSLVHVNGDRVKHGRHQALRPEVDSRYPKNVYYTIRLWIWLFLMCKVILLVPLVHHGNNQYSIDWCIIRFWK